MEGEHCSICAGEGRIENGFGRGTSCPACHGSGRRNDEGSGLRDVTKTKPSHHRPAVKPGAADKPQWPTTFEGGQLATEVRDSAVCASDTKARLIREIIEHEGSHGQCTQTFIKKVRKQVRPKPPAS